MMAKMANFMLYVENKKSKDSGRIFPWEYIFLFLFSCLKYIPPFCLFGFFLHFIGLENLKVWRLLHYTPLRM